MFSCPQCSSQSIWKDGHRRTGFGDVQRFLCRSCGYRFSEKRHKKVVNNPFEHRFHRQIGAESKAHGLVTNLVKVEPLKEGLAGATKLEKADTKGKIVEFAWKLKQDGYKDSTIERYMQGLATLLRKGADILNPESVKETIARQPWQEVTKLNYVNFYDSFAKFLRLPWERPRYKASTKIPFIPLESEIDLLIHATRGRLSAILQTVKETGLRIGEALRLKWTNVDAERNIIIVNDPEKGSRSGVYKVSTLLIRRILSLPRHGEFIFKARPRGIITHFSSVRKRLAHEHHNQRLRRITFHTIRHWKATVEYHKTKDLLHVKEMLRHRNINNTLIYIHLEKTLFKESPDDEFHARVAHTSDEACELVKVGFEYVCDVDGNKIFRKRK